MDPILEEQLKQRRLQSMARCQQYMADEHKRSTIESQTGQIAGRQVISISSTGSKESRVFDSHVLSNAEDRLLSNYVNTVKSPNQDFLHPGLIRA